MLAPVAFLRSCYKRHRGNQGAIRLLTWHVDKCGPHWASPISSALKVPEDYPVEAPRNGATRSERQTGSCARPPRRGQLVLSLPKTGHTRD
ncbi:hypothetical protein AURDEDRAFT_112063 [Auricularia subglabra TFB-10046 SS5]|nr:hypothetical protein AURDEDRAFT_112063 [Auricularia subglabra TFB-10046 SS5]